MLFVRVKSYYADGKFTSCEQLYAGDNQVKALERFRRDYPEHDKCILVAETIDDDEPCNKEYIRVCKQCGCVNYW